MLPLPSVGSHNRFEAPRLPGRGQEQIATARIGCRLAGIGRRIQPPDLSQHLPLHRGPYPACSKLCVFILLLGPHKETPKLLSSYPRRPRSTEWVEDEIPLPAGGKKGASYQT